MKHTNASAKKKSQTQAAIHNYLGLPAAPASEIAHDRARSEARDRAEAAIKQAEKAARRGDAADAKRWSEIASKLAESARVLAETRAPIDFEEEERVRAELRDRIRALAEDDAEMQRWQIRLEIWEEMAAEARAEGRPPPPPMPPRPAHWLDDMPEDLRRAFEAGD